MGWHSGLLAALLALLQTTTPPTPVGADVIVHLVERGGAPVADVKVWLQPRRPRYLRGTRLRGRTGGDGKVRLSGLAPGTYDIRLGLLPDHTQVRPEHDPRGRRLSLRLEEEDLVHRIEIDRGSPIEALALLEPGPPEPRRVLLVLQHVDTGFETSTPLRHRQPRFVALAAGRWRARVEVSPGWVLTELVHDRAELTGHVATIDVDTTGIPQAVTWSFLAPVEIVGSILRPDARPAGCSARSELLEPGPWVEAARARGGSEFDVVDAPTDRLGQFETRLPTGRWRITPVCKGELTSSEPEEYDLTLGDGASARADFVVTSRGRGSKSSLRVRVRNAELEGIDGAAVAVWRADQDPLAAEPVATARTRWRGQASIHGLEPGDYLVVAAHPDYLEGDAEATIDGEERRGSARIVLPRGSRVHAVARDGEDAPLAGVHFRLEPLDEIPLRVREPDLVAAKSAPEATTDGAGEAFLDGLYPGRYRVAGALGGSRRARAFVLAALPGERPVKDLELSLEAERETTIELRLQEAARLAGRLECDDRGVLPTTTALRVVPAFEEMMQASELDALTEYAEVREERLLLEGEARDELEVGPLEGGTYLVAVRPTGFSHWTWAQAATERADAWLIDVDPGTRAETGTLAVLCRPRIAVDVRSRDGAPLPDLDEAEIVATWSLELAGEVFDSGELAIEQEVASDRLWLYGAPEGEVRLQLSIAHPHFLTDGEATMDTVATLVRGHLSEHVIAVDGIGGSIVVEAKAGWVTSVRNGESLLHAAEVIDGEALIAPLVAGSYQVFACGAEPCVQVPPETLATVAVAVDEQVTVAPAPAPGAPAARR